MMRVQEESIHVLEFSGRRGNWKMWSVKFLACGSKKGYKSVVTGKDKLPTQNTYKASKANDNLTMTDEENISKPGSNGFFDFYSN